MKKFGVLKSKILKKLTESYAKGNKDEMKDLLLFLKENKDFKELYLFYEEIENMELSYPDSAQLYVETIEPLLIEKSQLVKNAYDKISRYVDNVEFEKNELYECLDVLSEQSNLSNVDKKIVAKKKLIEHLKTKKESKKVTTSTYTENEKMLHTVLANNFNVLYNNTLSENEKQELKNIIEMTEEDVNKKTSELKENILSKVSKMINESNDQDFLSKLNTVKEEVSKTSSSKYNYFKLKELESEL